jgi:hypothetical protein
LVAALHVSALLAFAGCDSESAQSPTEPAADGGASDASLPAADGGAEFVEQVISDECRALPADPKDGNLLIDCLRMIGTLRLQTGEFKPLTTYEGSLAYIAIAGDCRRS